MFRLGSTYQNAQKMHAMYKQFDKNGDGKITAEDVEILLKELGLGQVSPCECSHHSLTAAIDDVFL